MKRLTAKKSIAMLIILCLLAGLSACGAGKAAPADTSAGTAADPGSEADTDGTASDILRYFGMYVDGTYIETADNKDMDGWYVRLDSDGKGYLYLGENNQGDISEWSGEGDSFVMKAGVSVFSDDCFLDNGVLRLGFDSFVLVFVADGTDMDALGAVSQAEWLKIKAEEAAEAEAAEKASTAPSIEEQVIYEEDDVRITAKSIGLNEETGDLSLDLELENGTKDELSLTGKTVYINGLAVDASLYASAEAGETSTRESLIYGYSMKLNGIDTIGTIEFFLTGYDSSYGEVLKTDLLLIETDLKDSVKQGSPAGGEELEAGWDDDDAGEAIQVAYKRFYAPGELKSDEADLEFYIANASEDRTFYFYCKSPRINGKEVFSAFDQIMMPGKEGCVLFSIYNTALQEQGIEDIEQIEGTIGIFESDHYDPDKKVGEIEIDLKP